MKKLIILLSILWPLASWGGQTDPIYYSTEDDAHLLSSLPTIHAPLASVNQRTLNNDSSTPLYYHMILGVTIDVDANGQTGVPSGRTIDSVTMYLNTVTSSAANVVFDVREVIISPATPTWNQYDSGVGTDWNNKAISNDAHISDTTGSVGSATTTTTAAETLTIDISTAEEFSGATVTGPISMYFLIRLTSSGNSTIYTGGANRPRFVFDYSGAQPPTPTPTSTPTNTPTNTFTPSNTPMWLHNAANRPAVPNTTWPDDTPEYFHFRTFDEAAYQEATTLPQGDWRNSNDNPFESVGNPYNSYEAVGNASDESTASTVLGNLSGEAGSPVFTPGEEIPRKYFWVWVEAHVQQPDLASTLRPQKGAEFDGIIVDVSTPWAQWKNFNGWTSKSTLNPYEFRWDQHLRGSVYGGGYIRAERKASLTFPTNGQATGKWIVWNSAGTNGHSPFEECVKRFSGDGWT